MGLADRLFRLFSGRHANGTANNGAPAATERRAHHEELDDARARLRAVELRVAVMDVSNVPRAKER